MVLTALRIAEIVIGIGLVIFIHELGHFLLAKRNGVRCEIFSLGFGPAIWARRWGETEYRLSCIPLGGFVKMTGELPGEERAGEPYELTSKTVGQRFQIFVAGAVMNILFAFPICVMANWVGKYVSPAEVGTMGPPEQQGKMELGDVILEVDGTPIKTAQKYRMLMVKKALGSEVEVKVSRIVDGKRVEKVLKVIQSGSSQHLVQAVTTQVLEVKEGSPAWEAGFRPFDLIVAVGDKPVYTAEEAQTLLESAYDKPVQVRVRRQVGGTEKEEERTFTITVPRMREFVLPKGEDLIPAVVEGVNGDGAAYGKLEKGDCIVAVNGQEVSKLEMIDIVSNSAGKPLTFRVHRIDETVRKLDVTITPKFHEKMQRGLIGIALSRFGNGWVGHVREGGFYHKAKLRSGDFIADFGGMGRRDVTWLPERRCESLRLKILRPGEVVDLDLKGEERMRGELEKIGFETVADEKQAREMVEWSAYRVFRRWGFTDGLTDGLAEPIELAEITLVILWKILPFVAEESMTGLAGPVGIAHISYETARLGLGNFIWLMGLITISLGIFNLLPIPILDGGHCVLLLIEKIKGAPPSEKFIIRYQYVGLILILSLVLFVTYNDILRAFGLQ